MYTKWFAISLFPKSDTDDTKKVVNANEPIVLPFWQLIDGTQRHSVVASYIWIFTTTGFSDFKLVYIS